MDINDMLVKIGTVVVGALVFCGWLIWSIIKGIATVITFLIIFALLSAILPFHLGEIVLLILLLWFVWGHRHEITTVIGVLIACVLALMLLNTIKYSLLPTWAITKYSSIFSIDFVDRSFGVTEIKNKTLDSLTCYGSADLDNVVINGPLTSYGRVTADVLNVHGPVVVHGHATVNDVNVKDDLIVYGRLHLHKGFIAGTTNIYGRADIEESNLHDLIVYAKKIIVTSSIIKNIYMKNEYGRTTVTLVGSTVDGDIIFDGGNGKVILERGASVGGVVHGGTIVT